MFRKADPDHMLSRGTTYVRIFEAAVALCEQLRREVPWMLTGTSA